MLNQSEHLQLSKLIRMVQEQGLSFFEHLSPKVWFQEGFWLWTWEVLCFFKHEPALKNPEILQSLQSFQQSEGFVPWQQWAQSQLSQMALQTGHPMLYGWMYQFWQSSQKSNVDQQVQLGESVEQEQLSAKTQLFTEQYMVQWSVQNTVGTYWYSICKSHQWPIAEQIERYLHSLAERRRRKQQFCLLETDPLSQWQYYVDAPFENSDLDTIKNIKIIDPACGAGHFLIETMAFLFQCYQQEAQMRGLEWTDCQIVQWILTSNLHGVDIDAMVIEVAHLALRIQGYVLSGHFVDSEIAILCPPVLDVQGFLIILEQERFFDKKECQGWMEEIVELLQWGSLAKWPVFWNRLGSHGPVVKEKLQQYQPKFTRYWKIVDCQSYDTVMGNPPYLGIAHMMNSTYLQKHYPLGKWDLYTCFLLRGLEMIHSGALSCWLTMRGWLFTSTYEELRRHLFLHEHLWKIADIGSGGFAFSTGGPVMTNVISILQKSPNHDVMKKESTIVLPKPLHLQKGPNLMQQTQMGLQQQSQVFQVSVHQYSLVEKWPFLYWWSKEWVDMYLGNQKIQDIADVCVGLQTGDNLRFVRAIHEVPFKDVLVMQSRDEEYLKSAHWVPYIKGAKQQRWFEPLKHVVKYKNGMAEMIAVQRKGRPAARPQNRSFYFRLGIAYSTIGNHFSARLHRYCSVFDVSGSSVFVKDGSNALAICASLNSQIPTQMASDLNPTQNFQVNDIARLPVIQIANVERLWEVLEESFVRHEQGRETSIEFQWPQSSSWNNATKWAQAWINGDHQPIENILLEAVSSEQSFSFIFGQSLGRFHSKGGWAASLNFWKVPTNKMAIADVLFIDAENESCDDLNDAHFAALWKIWDAAPLDNRGLRYYLCQKFFDQHYQDYDKRPIYWPLSSQDQRFVLWVNIHQLTYQTLPNALQRLQEKLVQYPHLKETSFVQFCDDFAQCIFKGPMNLNAQQSKQDHPYHPNIHDGVWVNAAALWPLLHPQWQDGKYHPKAMWNLLCSDDVKNLDWSTLARLYFPDRVQQKMAHDPSLQMAHAEAIHQKIQVEEMPK